MKTIRFRFDRRLNIVAKKPKQTLRSLLKDSQNYSLQAREEIVLHSKVNTPKPLIEPFWGSPRDDFEASLNREMLASGADERGLMSLSSLDHMPNRSTRVKYFKKSHFGSLLPNVFEAKNVLVFCGSGVSIPYGVPSMSVITEKATQLLGQPMKDAQTIFDALRKHAGELSQFVSWFQESCKAATRRLWVDKESFPHYIIMKLWQDGYIDTLATTNWDLLFEESAKLIEWGGTVDNLISGPEYWNVVYETHRWDATYDKKHLVRWIRPTWTIISRKEDMDRADGPNKLKFFKIHGSPPYYFCPQCKDSARWKEIPTGVSTPHTCVEHNTPLVLDVVLPNAIDRADPIVLSTLEAELAASDVIMCVGYSGNSDYLFERLFRTVLGKIIIIDPNPQRSRFASSSKPLLIKTDAERLFLEVGGWLMSRDTREKADPKSEKQAIDGSFDRWARKMEEQRRLLQPYRDDDLMR